MSKESSIKRIEYELTTLIRKAVFRDQSDRKIGILERSAYLLMRQLDEQGPSRLKQLAEAFQLDISTLSRQAAALEAKKLIQRFSDPSDGRVSLFDLTERGKEKLALDSRMRLEWYEGLLEGWSDEEKNVFGELLVRMNGTFDE
ncbi:MarR family winged helix-turn-helix transcriptional regulator [Rossellomorea vietnamensis]|uniref:MarR family transcriptional regulator n=1 Tax=Rossellomorea vietnamensis TaxID=218284 RepID=A0A0P6VZQ4_9BACI|nr:MarR family transcriptional regulator [Rossellomorea vietnamensis]KPL58531.1 MarR family transcriptional regulator [Rossellomorea vietnamensis]